MLSSWSYTVEGDCCAGKGGSAREYGKEAGEKPKDRWETVVISTPVRVGIDE